MTDFLIKSTVAMGVLLGLYYILFEKEKMHRFNRFYLLGALVFSFVVPFININTSTPSVVNTASVTLEELVIGTPVVVTQQPEEFNYALLIWLIYAVICTLFLFRFDNNIFYFIRKAKNSETLDYEKATLVLIPERVLPHTFLNYIFVNEDDYQQKNIESELYTHELTHIRQKHTLDIIFIEIVKIIFWFNPLLYMYKKAIQLNHEFLADENVINIHNNITPYQNLLLTKASGAQSFALASNLNFSITKKRLLMMTKHTSRIQATIKKAAVLPLLAGVVFISYSQAATLKNLEIVELPEIAKDAYTNFGNDNAATIQAEPAKQETPVVNEQPLKTQQDTVKDPIEKLANLTKQPEYPGGMMEFYKYVNKNFKIPEGAVGTLKTYVSFVIEKDGNITNIKVMRAPFEELGKEAVRVISGSQKWTPGEIKGKKVRTSYNLPITINIAEPKSEFLQDSKIDSDKIKRIEIHQLTETEISALKELDPDKYNDTTLKEYKAVKISYVNDKGNLVSETTYEKSPK
jgi:beta-lactamase regulating signal transducer with metallopeptidase domain